MRNADRVSRDLSRLARLNVDLAAAEERALRFAQPEERIALERAIADHTRHAREIAERLQRIEGGAAKPDLRARYFTAREILEARLGRLLEAMRAQEIMVNAAYHEALEEKLTPHLPESRTINALLGREEKETEHGLSEFDAETWSLLVRQCEEEERHLETVTRMLAERSRPTPPPTA